ncbi:MAG TPA: hypothetical protein VGC53_13960 [Vicinamibacteria bacterium]
MRVHGYSRPVFGLSTVRSRIIRKLFDQYERRLLGSGYNDKVIRLHLHSVAHFVVWIDLEDRPLKAIDEETLRAFERHRSTCKCLGTSRNRHRNVLSCVRRFLQHLRERGVVPIAEVRLQRARLVERFLQWMKVDRGVVESTLRSYGS